MSKFATAAPARPKGYIQTSPVADTLTHEGSAGFSRDAKSELFLLAVANMVREDTFYEKAGDRDARFEALIRQVTAEDPGWVARFVPYLRDEMGMRSASVVMAAEYARAKGPGARAVIASACLRADEPAEVIGYWLSTTGRKLPAPVKRGVADAATRLYNERAAMKYDGKDRPIRFADVIDLTHPKPKADWQSALFKHLLNDRHGHESDLTLLPLLAARAEGGRSADTEVDWQAAASAYGKKLDAAFWEGQIPKMGLFALLRNLRNFDDADISAESRLAVVTRLTDADAIGKSRIFPMRFLAAFRAVRTLYWGQPLEEALGHSLSNVPALKGRTLVLMDISGSMDGAMSAKSDLNRFDSGAAFAAALALRAENVDLVAFCTTSRAVPVPKVGSVLKLVEQMRRQPNEQGGTNTLQAINRHFANHDRVVLVTDEQAFPAYDVPWNGASLPAPTIVFNLGGYRAGFAGGKNVVTIGGMNDKAFLVLDLIERGRTADWPF